MGTSTTSPTTGSAAAAGSASTVTSDDVDETVNKYARQYLPPELADSFTHIWNDTDEDKHDEVGGFLASIPVVGPIWNAIQKFFKALGSALEWVQFRILYPSTYHALQGMLDHIDHSEVFNTLVSPDGLGLPAEVAQHVRHIATKGVEDFINFGDMPHDPRVAIAKLIETHNKIVTELETALAEKYGTHLTAEKRAEIANNAASSITGLDPDVLADPQAAALILNQWNDPKAPKTGLFGMVLTTQAAIGVDKPPQGYQVPDITAGLDAAGNAPLAQANKDLNAALSAGTVAQAAPAAQPAASPAAARTVTLPAQGNVQQQAAAAAPRETTVTGGAPHEGDPHPGHAAAVPNPQQTAQATQAPQAPAVQ